MIFEEIIFIEAYLALWAHYSVVWYAEYLVFLSLIFGPSQVMFIIWLDSLNCSDPLPTVMKPWSTFYKTNVFAVSRCILILFRVSAAKYVH